MAATLVRRGQYSRTPGSPPSTHAALVYRRKLSLELREDGGASVSRIHGGHSPPPSPSVWLWTRTEAHLLLRLAVVPLDLSAGSSGRFLIQQMAAGRSTAKFNLSSATLRTMFRTTSSPDPVLRGGWH